jgi:SAM-dependent methyltransferase
MPAARAMGRRESYDAAAQAYAEHLADELDRKPLDRHLLNRFAEEVQGQGMVADLGCGPGHVARYLSDQGVRVTGLDLSEQMIRVAVSRNPGIEFRVVDITSLDVDDGTYAGAILFYSLVHFEKSALGKVLREVRRVLTPAGLVLVAFHIGDQAVQVDELFGVRVSLEFRFFPPALVCEALAGAGFHVIEQIEREPYEGAEYPSRRCYLLARAT